MLILCSVLFTLSNCTPEKKQVSVPSKKLSTNDVSFTWQLDSLNLEKRVSYITSTIHNNTDSTLTNSWSLYYNQILGGPDQSSLPKEIIVKRHSGTFFSIHPSETFQELKANSSFSYSYEMQVPIIRECDVPIGMYIVQDESEPLLLENVEVKGLNQSVLKDLPLENPERRFVENQSTTRMSLMPFDMIIPRPKRTRDLGGLFTFKHNISYSTSEGLEREAKWLKTILSQSFTGDITESESGQIQLVIDKAYQESEGGYYLNINDNGVLITANHPEGIFNGISSLGQLVSPKSYQNPSRTIQVSYTEIYDGPAYPYRGIMLDVSRNFHEVESVKKLLDAMAFYKLNKLHFHLGDDEGWRVEIPGLPELTEVGARRGHTLDEVKSGFLQPAYGSGPHPDPKDSYGSGWYTRDEYIDILRYATDRHIEVIPEFDMPGHARAAIIAMDYRYEKYMAAGDKEKAEQYLLSDPTDSSKYRSAQGYGDNSMCVCRESTFDFVEKVLSEVVEMYEEAEAPLKVFHSGGDEVAYGSWQKSPICQDFIKANSESVSNTNGLQPYFTNRYKSIIAKYGLVTAGWEEFVLKNSSAGHHGKELNPKFIGENMQPFVWNATWGWGREDMAYQLANAGYKTVMCNSAQLYFDMAYNMDPKESGLMWTGMVDTKNPFFLIPDDIYAMPYKKNNIGVVVDDRLFDNHVRLTEEGRKNMLGIQGHLWSETVVNAEKIDYYLFPKTLGLSERAWTGSPSWPMIEDTDERWETMQKAWHEFANKVGQRHLPILDHIFGGIDYRIPLPGITSSDNQMMTNVRFPGITMRFTTDGSEPDENDPIVRGPIDGINIKVKAFSTSGRSSRTSELNIR